MKNLLEVVLDALIMAVMLPVMLVEYLIGGLTMLASVGSLLQCEDRITAIKFITAYQSGTLLKGKFPNSIAVRS